MTLTPILPYLSGIIAVVGWPIAAFFAYRFGLRSQKAASKRESKIAALAALDQVRLEIRASGGLPEIVAPAQARLKTPVFNFSARLNPKRRHRIEAAWQAYQSVGDYDVHPDNPKFRDARPAADKARPLLLEPLAKLRIEIDDA